LRAWTVHRQGWLFFPLLFLVGLDLHQVSLRSLLDRRQTQGRALELSLISLRFALYLGALFWLLPLSMAFAFLGVQLAAFGFSWVPALRPTTSVCPSWPPTRN
jgi:hypothetical protein